MSKPDGGAGLRPAPAGPKPASTQIFGKTVKAREGWGPEHRVHLHRYIAPRQTIGIPGGRDFVHCPIHSPVAFGRKGTHS